MHWKSVARFPKPKNKLIEGISSNMPTMYMHVNSLFHLGFFKNKGDWNRPFMNDLMT